MSIDENKMKLVANTIRGLSMDTVQAANSGHPGMPMGAADFASVLFLKYLKYNPKNPKWANRDRFVLSAGHGSALIYSLLHLAGYNLSVDDLKNFRQWESKTPGHPEVGVTEGVEISTGPLGQGCGNAVGMAIAEAMLAERFNTDDANVIDHNTFAYISDGELMEGISHEAFAFAGHLGLNKLIAFYDSNRITIEGSTDLAYTDDVKKRFESYNWKVLEVDGHNIKELEDALDVAVNEKEKPVIIIGHTHIGMGSLELADTSKVHGEPLGEDNIKLAKKNLGLPEDKSFYVSDEVKEIFGERVKELQAENDKWDELYKNYKQNSPEKEKELQSFLKSELPADLNGILPEFDVSKPIATRAVSGKVIQALSENISSLIGGSADLAPSNKTYMSGAGDISKDSFGGRNFHFGIREHGMASILNGIAVHGGFRVFGATFYVFADYMRPSMRLAAMMNLPVTYVLTHDSFYVGEDGPTHQPIEHSASLRAMPNMTVIRPADATETGAAWVAALKNTTGPTALLLTRQNLPVIDRSKYPSATLVEQGAYTLWQSGEGTPDLILIGSGSEVSLVLDAGKEIASTEKKNVRVVSMPCWELFEKQTDDVKESVLPKACKKRFAAEAGSSMGWEKYIGDEGAMLSIDDFGASAPAGVLAEKFGFTVSNVVEKAKKLL